jgi:hypothetical protein
MLASQARRTPGSRPHANDHRLTPPVVISETVIREVGHHVGAENGWHRELLLSRQISLPHAAAGSSELTGGGRKHDA